MDFQKLKENKSLKLIIGVLVFILLSIILYIGIYKYQDNKDFKESVIINNLVHDYSYENCVFILSKNLDNKYINTSLLNPFLDFCTNFDISKVDTKEENNCDSIISSNSSKDLQGEYIYLDGYDSVKKECISNFQKYSFSTGSFFDIENDFKTTISINFLKAFFTDLDDSESPEFLENRIEAKQRLIDSLEISPNVNLSVDDVVLYPNSATLYLKLEPTTGYSIKVKGAKIRGKENIEKIEELYSGEAKISYNTTYEELTSFDFTTPENKYLGIKIKNPVSLYMDNMAPKFEILDYDSGKKSLEVKICRIDEEIYSKIDILNGESLSTENKDFFINNIDDLKTESCKTKEIIIREEGNTDKFIRKEFNFDEQIDNPARNGLYYVTFDNYIDREFNLRVQKPILFGIINSHITMKISRDGEVFFFVNDFEGNPLSGQNIRIYLNDFKSKYKSWNNSKREYEETFYSPLDMNVLSKEIFIGTTGKDGILKADLKNIVPEYFSRTFDDEWSYDWTGIYNAFFVKASSANYLSYNSSKWNSGIAPWNFGYTVGGYWINQNGDDIVLNRWGQIEPDYYSHTYTDRVLYLPGEEVNFKTIVRSSKDLSIEKNKDFSVKVLDSNGKEIYSKTLKTNEFGSIFDSLDLGINSPLGYYSIIISDGDNQIGYTTFSVEVFKNPKFKTDISLQTYGLEAGAIKIDEVNKVNYRIEEYKGKFSLKANISSKYYNGAILSGANYTYKIYKQPYYNNAWWEDCFYGCYWEPEKEFYSSGEGKLDENGVASINTDIDFKSNYDDYKYILEVTISDISGDTISSSNSVVVKLPDEYKKWNNNFSLHLSSENKFYKSGETFKITGELDGGKWTKYFDDKYVLIVKKKDYITKDVEDVRGYTRKVNEVKETLEDIMFINSNNFKVTNEGKIEFDYKLKNSGEYIFEYGKIDDNLELADSENIEDIINEFDTTKNLSVNIDRKYRSRIYERTNNQIINPCENKKNCSYSIETYENHGTYNTGRIFNIVEEKNEDLSIDNLLDYSKTCFSLLGYSYINASNPAINDNKLHVFAEKTVYKLGEKARVLVRLPFSKGKILWTIEKQGVIHSEYIDVNSNIFFKEFDVDDSFVPNAYIGVTAIEVDGQKVPEYKVGYTEIVVDKTDKKSFISISSDKTTYSPREEVSLNLEVKDKDGNPKKSELSVMIVDDSLISLMGNIDLNLLEKFYKKLPFQIQTSLTNLSMLKNFYFARPGIVGGSGYGNFKGGDSAVSTRNIFKNTAYYNASVITDENGKANVKFNLPDNLTNFRIIVVGNSSDNYFGAAQEFIEVRKNVIVEPKTPLILRDGDELQIGANIFNNTDEKLGFKVNFNSDFLEYENIEKLVDIEANKSSFVYFNVKNNTNSGTINYTISALGDSPENSDKYEGTIEIKQSPVIIQNRIKRMIISQNDVKSINIGVPENTDLEKSKVEVVFSNNRLVGIENILKSLMAYPYGCIEQTTSATLPNAILKKFLSVLKNISIDEAKVDENINYGLDRIRSMQVSSGGFAYWTGDSIANAHITPYVLRSLIDMKDMGVYIEDSMIQNALSYIENNYSIVDYDFNKSEVLWTLAKYYKTDLDTKYIDSIKNMSLLSRHDLISYTYGLVLSGKSKYKDIIEQNIEKIKTILDISENYWYWNKFSDKAIFTSMLIDYGYDVSYIDTLILDLYDNDWSSYYYSTQTKNNTFLAFVKYNEEYEYNRQNNFGFMLGKILNRDSYFYLGGTNPNIIKNEYNLDDVLYTKDEGIELRVANTSGKDMYADLTLKQYPKDIEKLESFSSGVEVKREIYEVLDSSKLDACEKAQNNYYNRDKNIDSLPECQGIYALHSSKEFGKGKTYKAKITIKFPSSKLRRNIVLEDYLASSFRVLNNKFQTESISTSQNTTKSWTWDHVEFNSGVVFANSSTSYGDTLEFEYFFIPEFEGTFTYPPVTAYMMYDPQVRANSTFQKIEVK